MKSKEANLMFGLILLTLILGICLYYAMTHPKIEIVEKDVPVEIIKPIYIGNNTQSVTESHTWSENIIKCLEPKKDDCRIGLKARTISINVKCSDGSVKVWDCIKQRWK